MTAPWVGEPAPGGEIGTCGMGYCDRPAVAYVSRTVVTRTGGGRLLTIVGRRADWLAHTGSAELGGAVQLRCLECAHHELDVLLREAADLPARTPERSAT